MIRAAGILYQAADGRVLLVHRTDGEGWATSGGHIENGETAAEAAAREAREELGPAAPTEGLRLHARRQWDGVDYTMFLVRVPETFEPVLDEEHDEFRWVHPEELAEARADRAFEEQDHPRAPDGRFGRAGRAAVASVRKFGHEDHRVLSQHFHHARPADRSRIAHGVRAMIRSVPDLVRSHVAEERDHAVHAVGALRALAGGNRPSPRQMQGLRSFGARVLMTGASVALGDPTGSLGHLAAHFGHEVVQHVIVEHAIKMFAGVGRAIVRKDGAGEDGDEDVVRRFIEALAKSVETLSEADAEEILAEARADAEFREGDHPRDAGGKFSSAGGGGMQPLDRAAAPAHVAKLKVPPAWRDVHYNPDPEAPLQVIGLDAKDRVVRIYSAKFAASQSASKFRRIQELESKHDEVVAQNEAARRSEDPRVRDSADCTALVAEMGIRPGSDEDTGAKVKAYGATTLEGRHVVDEDGDVRLRFVGKKGVAIDLPVPEGLREMLRTRREAAGPDGRLFPETDAARLLEHVHTLDGGGFKTKDFRTLLATKAAQAAVAADPTPPATAAEYRRRVMKVATLVSGRLGNTPAVALQSYISPTVFSSWQTTG